MTEGSTGKKPIRAIVTGATGMVGEGVLHECLGHPDVERVLVLGRRSCGVSHPKLTETLHDNFYDWTPLAPQLSGYNACFFCLGVSSIGKKEAEYARLTYDLTVEAAKLLAELNPDMAFCYVSGSGTDSTERGRSMWARVKGRTENALLRLPFRSAYMFRPGYIHPTKGLKNAHRAYALVSWLYPPLVRLMPNRLVSLKQLGLAMINAAGSGYPRSLLGSREIVDLAGRNGG